MSRAESDLAAARVAAFFARRGGKAASLAKSAGDMADRQYLQVEAESDARSAARAAAFAEGDAFIVRGAKP